MTVATAIRKESLRQSVLDFLTLELRGAQGEQKRFQRLLRDADREALGEFSSSRAVLYKDLQGIEERIRTISEATRAFQNLSREDRHTVALGAVVEVCITPHVRETYLIGPALGGGCFVAEGRTFFVLTPESPRGKFLWNKRAGDVVMCGEEKIEIAAVY